MKDYVGFGALSEALMDLEEGPYRKILVVTSGRGWDRFLAEGERPFFTTRETALFTGFSPNPDFEEILGGAETMRAFQPDLLIALGGGSPMDVAKMMKAVVHTGEPFDPDHPESIKPSGEGPPLVAIATTAGSGSEATQFAVFYKNNVKQSLADPFLRPEMAVADPEMCYSLPPEVTAATGFDALSQAVEAFWGTGATEESDALALEAIRDALDHLENAVHKPGPDNRYHMTHSAYLSGRAINITRTTMPHALAYHLTKRYGLPHGHAVAVTLPVFFVINMDPALPVNPPRDREGLNTVMNRLFACMGENTPEGALARWRDLMRSCGLPATLREVGVDTREKVAALVDSMNLARMKNHPVAVGAEALAHYFLDHP